MSQEYFDRAKAFYDNLREQQRLHPESFLPQVTSERPVGLNYGPGRGEGPDPEMYPATIYNGVPVDWVEKLPAKEPIQNFGLTTGDIPRNDLLEDLGGLPPKEDRPTPTDLVETPHAGSQDGYKDGAAKVRTGMVGGGRGRPGVGSVPRKAVGR